MGGDQRQQQDPNVIIPDIGAGPYWYVDPKAGVAQQPQQAYGAQSQIDHPSIEIMKAVQRLINPDPQQQVAASAAMSHMSGQYDPMEAVRLGRQQEAERMSAEHQMSPEDVFKTVTLDIGGKQWEAPAVFDNMTDQERNIIQYLPHTQWPKDIHQKIEDNARDNLEQGNDPFGNPLNKAVKYGF